MNRRVRGLIGRFGLAPHPEGGFFKETYRSPHSTAIYYLLPAGEKSHLHRIKSDELWHFHEGGALELTQISPKGAVESVVVGPERPQHCVPAGYWFGAEPKKGCAYSFVGCTVAPAFRFKDFELGERKRLLAEFPAARAAIERLTRAK